MAAIIPFFIEHCGCPHRCLFCNQNAIAGTEKSSCAGQQERLRETIDLWLSRFAGASRIQLAFYGGSFTCLPEEVQILLLDGAKPYLDRGEIASLRLSTRPDCITAGIGDFLWDYRVRTVELGVQSMNDTVLELSERGHNAADVRLAASRLKARGFSLGVQLMPGLPGETTRIFMETVEQVIRLAPDFVRIYPALVISNTGLERLYNASAYRPLSMNRAIALTARARSLFVKEGIEVIRMGLQPSETLEKRVIAGPYHQAFGELVVSRSWLQRMRKIVSSAGGEGRICVTISERDRSSFVGVGKANMKRLERLFPCCRIELNTDKAMARGEITYALG